MNLHEFIALVSDITNIPVNQIKETSNIRDDLGIDSLNMVNLFVELAEKTGIGFERFLSTEKMKTIGEIYQFIKDGAK